MSQHLYNFIPFLFLIFFQQVNTFFLFLSISKFIYIHDLFLIYMLDLDLSLKLRFIFHFTGHVDLLIFLRVIDLADGISLLFISIDQLSWSACNLWLKLIYSFLWEISRNRLLYFWPWFGSMWRYRRIFEKLLGLLFWFVFWHPSLFFLKVLS